MSSSSLPQLISSTTAPYSLQSTFPDSYASNPYPSSQVAAYAPPQDPYAAALGGQYGDLQTAPYSSNYVDVASPSASDPYAPGGLLASRTSSPVNARPAAALGARFTRPLPGFPAPSFGAGFARWFRWMLGLGLLLLAGYVVYKLMRPGPTPPPASGPSIPVPPPSPVPPCPPVPPPCPPVPPCPKAEEIVVKLSKENSPLMVKLDGQTPDECKTRRDSAAPAASPLVVINESRHSPEEAFTIGDQWQLKFPTNTGTQSRDSNMVYTEIGGAL